MAKITYIEHSGTEHTVEIANGDNLMDGAVDNDLPGIDALCGGCCSCSTCHVYVDEAWVGKVPAADEDELGVLEGASERRPTSRLACQVEVSDALDGLVVRLPAEQG